MIYSCSLKALSPTSLKSFEDSIDNFVMRYVLNQPRNPQTQAMSIGSAFDARIKAYLAKEILGIDGWEEKLLMNQVEEHNREWAFAESVQVFQDYLNAGCAKALIREIGEAISLRFEFEQFKTLKYADGYEVPLYGKPDAYFQRKDKLQIVIDWKVNGFCSAASPAPGYVKLIHPNGMDVGAHKTCFPRMYKGILCATGDVPVQWRDQLRMYTWMLGEEGDWVAGIDQLVYRNGSPRYAIHRLKIDDDENLRQRIRFAWEHISSGHYYHDRSREENDMRLEMLMTNPALKDSLSFRNF